MKNRYGVTKSHNNNYMLFLLFCFLAIAGGCAGTNSHSGTYGSLDRNREVTDLFRSFQVLPDHRYYYSGPDAYPSVTIGIHKDYTLVSKFWKPIEMTPGVLKSWSDWSQASLGRGYYRLWGANIVGAQGQQVGVWFPFRNRLAWGRVIVNPDNTVGITTPIQNEPRRLRIIGRQTED